jgi:predicted RNA binding protein YcfA (HicA-like mRNA interferase family)
MSAMPIISGRECVKALEKAGFQVARRKGSHITLKRSDPYAKVIVPDHKEIHKGTLRNIMRQAGLSLDELKAFLEE